MSFIYSINSNLDVIAAIRWSACQGRDRKKRDQRAMLGPNAFVSSKICCRDRIWSSTTLLGEQRVSKSGAVRRGCNLQPETR